MKKILLAMLTTCAAAIASAQESPLSLRLTVGSTSSFPTVSGGGYEPKPDISFGYGVELDRRLGRQTALTLGFAYTINQLDLDNITFGFTDYLLEEPLQLTSAALSFAETSDMRIKMEYIGLPLLMNYQPWKRLTLKAGIEPCLLLSSSMEYHLKDYRGTIPFTKADIGSGQVTPYELNMTGGSKYRFKNIDLAIPLGVSYEYKNIVFEWRYHIGLSDITRDSKTVRLGYSLLSVGFRLPL